MLAGNSLISFLNSRSEENSTLITKLNLILEQPMAKQMTVYRWAGLAVTKAAWSFQKDDDNFLILFLVDKLLIPKYFRIILSLNSFSMETIASLHLDQFNFEIILQFL